MISNQRPHLLNQNSVEAGLPEHLSVSLIIDYSIINKLKTVIFHLNHENLTDPDF
jgi:hypothetical protein